jgi:hypothetical protein
MAQNEIARINSEWAKRLTQSGILNYMVYAPFTEGYWTTEVKICICNLETYGYENCGITHVDLERFSGWMQATHITKTARYTSVFVNALVSGLSGKNMSIEEMRHSYYDFDRLKQSVSTITYMNFRKSSNPNVNQDGHAILTEVSENADLLQEFIATLKPRVLLVGGQVGAAAFNIAFKPQTALQYNGKINFDGTLVFSVRHFSRISYKYLKAKVDEIITETSRP